MYLFDTLVILALVSAIVYYNRDVIAKLIQAKRNLIPAQYAEWFDKWIDWSDLEEAWAKAEELGRTVVEKQKIAADYLKGAALAVGKEMKDHVANFFVELIVSIKKEAAKL